MPSPDSARVSCRVERRLRLPLEVRKDLLREQLCRTSGVLRVRPIVTHLQHAAETTGLVPQPLYLTSGLLRCADDTDPGLVDEVDHLAQTRTGDRHLREGRDVLEDRKSTRLNYS